MCGVEAESTGVGGTTPEVTQLALMPSKDKQWHLKEKKHKISRQVEQVEQAQANASHLELRASKSIQRASMSFKRSPTDAPKSHR